MEWMHHANRAIRRMLTAQGVVSDHARVQGADVHFYRAEGRGKGPPLMLLHGLGSSANAFFRTMVPLARTFREVWAIDLPGNGFSTLPPGGPMGIRKQVDLLLEFRQRIVAQQVFLVGNSLGGGMSLYAASQDPNALKALGLVSPAGAKVADERLAELIRTFDVNDVKKARELAHKLFHKVPLPLLLFADELRKMVSTPTVRAIVKEVTPADAVSEELLRALPMPTLLIWGQSEKLLPYEGLDYFRRHLPPHAEVHEVKGFGHMPQMEHPRELVARLTRFAHARGLA